MWTKRKGCRQKKCKKIVHKNIGGSTAVSASRLVKSPDSHASDPCSRLGGSSWLCYEIFISEFNEMREEKFFSRHLAWISGKLAVRGLNSLAKVLRPCKYIRRYIAEFNEIECCSSQYSGKNRVTLTMKQIEAGRQFPMNKAVALAACRQRGLSANPVHRVGEEKLREENRWALNTVRKSQAASRWGRGNSAPLPHTRAQTRVPGQWVGYSSAVPGCHNSVGQMSPGRTQLLLLLLRKYERVRYHNEALAHLSTMKHANVHSISVWLLFMLNIRVPQVIITYDTKQKKSICMSPVILLITCHPTNCG